MSFAKDFTQTDRGDLYPLLSRSANTVESITDHRWHVNGEVSRLLGQFFPYATYALSVDSLNGAAGFRLILLHTEAMVALACKAGEYRIVFDCGDVHETVLTERATDTLIVSCRPGAFDCYVLKNGKPIFVKSFRAPTFGDSARQPVFERSVAAVCISGNACVRSVESYLDNGISQADLRPIRCENGEIFCEDGKIWLTASIRLQEGCFQGVFSWIPTTAELTYTGALFFATEDQVWGNDVASSILWHRAERRWYLWVCSFSRGHILGHAVIDGEIRRGINVVDITLLPTATAENADTDFVGFTRDEDPDFYFDEAERCWYMAICRRDPETERYRYYFFRSDEPFAGYQFLGKGLPGSETGGSFARIGGERYFICGNSFDARSDYRIYSTAGMQNAVFDYPDGGFRGWGTLIPLKLGTRTRLYWLTFDRQLGSDYNWSYGNIHCFEADWYSKI